MIVVNEKEWYELGSTKAVFLGKLRSMAIDGKVMLSIGKIAAECNMTYNNASRLLLELRDWEYLEHITNEKGNRIVGVRLL